MDKIIVCGCSFSAVSNMEQYRGTHWSELLAQRLNCEVINYARQGISNGGIRIQIDEAIKQKPDLVILTPTVIDRIEIPYTATPVAWQNSTFDKIRDILNDFQGVSKHGYEPGLGIKNLNYSGTEPYRLISENFLFLLSDHHGPSRVNKLYPEVLEAVRGYVSYMYDPSWKRQMDQWIIRDGLQQLKNNNIPYILQPQLLWHSGDINLNRRQVAGKFLGQQLDNNLIDDFDCILTLAETNPIYKDGESISEDPGYHTTPKLQEQFVELLEQYIKFLN